MPTASAAPLNKLSGGHDGEGLSAPRVARLRSASVRLGLARALFKKRVSFVGSEPKPGANQESADVFLLNLWE